MPLHSEIVDHLERLDIRVPGDIESHAIEILSKQVQWPRRPFATSFERRREWLVDIGVDEAEDWDEGELLEYSFTDGPKHSVGLYLGSTVPLDFYTGVNPEIATWWSEDSSHLLFLQENPNDRSDPIVSILDSEEVEEAPYEAGTVSELLGLLEPH